MTTLILPSGLTVEAERPNLLRLAVASPNNEIPRYLTAIVMAEIRPSFSISQETSVNAEQLMRLSHFMDRLITICLTWPRIVAQTADYEAGEIVIGDLSEADRRYLFSWAMPADVEAVTVFAHNLKALWELYQVGKTYHTRPSALIGITDTWLAWDFDHAVTVLARYIENEIHEPTTNEGQQAQSKAENTVNRLLGIKSVNLIDTHEKAIAAGFIPTPAKKKDAT